MGLLGEVLPPGRVIERMPVKDSWAVVEFLLDSMSADPAIEQLGKVVEGFRERHEEDHLALGRGVWLPHLRTVHAKKVLCALGRWPEGVNYEWCPEPIHFVALVVAPAGMVNEYLRTVGMLARVFGNALKYEAMLGAADGKGMLGELLRDGL